MRIEKHKYVQFRYQITDSNGSLLERSDVPVNYLHGHDSGLMEKLEQRLEGKTTGDVVAVTLLPEEGFGQSDPALLYEEQLENVPPQLRFVRAEATFQNDRGDTRTFIVTRIDQNKVLLDGNHPLAGKELLFTVYVDQVRDATAAELSGEVPTGRLVMPGAGFPN